MRFMLQLASVATVEEDPRFWYAVKRLVTGRSAIDPATGQPSNEPFEGTPSLSGVAVPVRGWVELDPEQS